MLAVLSLQLVLTAMPAAPAPEPFTAPVVAAAQKKGDPKGGAKKPGKAKRPHAGKPKRPTGDKPKRPKGRPGKGHPVRPGKGPGAGKGPKGGDGKKKGGKPKGGGGGA